MPNRSKMRIGFISRIDLKLNPHLKGRFEFHEASFTRKITLRGDRVYSKLLNHPVDYEEITSNARLMKNNPNLIVVCEPFLLDDELREKVIRWVNWANNADPKDYDPFC